MKKGYLFALVLAIGLCFVISGAWFSAKEYTVAFINDTVLVSIGCSLIAAAIYEKLASTSNQNMEIYYNEVYNNLGILKVFKNRTQPESDCKKIIRDSKGELCALGHTMNRFMQQNRMELLEAAKRGVQIKILALSDEKIMTNKEISKDAFSLISQRQCEETIHDLINGEYTSNNLKKIVREINQQIVHSSRPGKQISLAFYIALPINSTLYNEKEMIAGSFFHQKESGSSFTLKLKIGELFDQYQSHFNSLWNDKRFVKYCEDVNF